LLGVLWLLVAHKNPAGIQLFAKPRRLILDSCALIDGRITEIVRTGFIADELVIPQFIVNELQMLADGNDSHKRERARYGLDIAHELQDSAPMKVTVDRTVLPNISATDDKLVALAKKLRGALYTTDYNLGKVAAVEGVPVLNVNELSQSIRPIALPGETLNIKVIQKGSNRDQGVGYLDDGTMIVIEGGARHVGREMPVTVTRMHQTVAGKMVFGQVKEQRQADRQQQEQPSNEQPRQQQQQSRQQNSQHRAKQRMPQAHDATGMTSTKDQSQAQLLRSKLQNKLHARLHPASRRRPL
jgi:uncharacterized protein YacL